MPKSKVRLAAGRLNLTFSDQALCFLAGANSVFSGQARTLLIDRERPTTLCLGDKLLTTSNNDQDEDEVMFRELGLRPAEAIL